MAHHMAAMCHVRPTVLEPHTTSLCRPAVLGVRRDHPTVRLLQRLQRLAPQRRLAVLDRLLQAPQLQARPAALPEHHSVLGLLAQEDVEVESLGGLSKKALGHDFITISIAFGWLSHLLGR